MIINRHNYEEFFLMYVDNELCAEDRIAVEDFVKQNPDLHNELTALQHATLAIDDDIVFEGKEGLKKNGYEISFDNYQDFFLLHVDDELSAKQKQEVERFVLQHPAVQNDFTLLQQTKLEPEPIVFENKSVLYKTRERKVVPLYWMRIAVAAAFIGLAFLLYTLIPTARHSNSTSDSFAGNTKVTDKPAAVTKQDVAIQNVKPADEDLEPVTRPTSQPLNPATKPGNLNPVTGKKVETPSVAATNAPATVNAAIDNNLPKPQTMPRPVITNNNSDELYNNDVAAVTPRTSPAGNPVVTQAATTGDGQEDVVKQAVYKELDTRSAEEENSILFGSTQINKNKLRGFLKKATRIFDKGGDKADNEKPVRIASFELR